MEYNKVYYGKKQKKIDQFNLSRKPKKQPVWTILLIIIVSWLSLLGKKRRLNKINIENLPKKQPYLLLCNHQSFIDFEVVAKAIWPRRSNNVMSIDAWNIWSGLLWHFGGIPKRKFTNSPALLRQLHHVLKKNKSIAGVYPEARYSSSGTTAILPDSLGKMIKFFKVPVVTMIFHGHHLYSPAWGSKRNRKRSGVPLEADMTYLLNPQQIEEKSTEEINAIVRKAFLYDEYDYQKKNNILIRHKYRAEGLERILYKCPHCRTDFSMTSEGEHIRCTNCGNVYYLQLDGTLANPSGETKFSRIPDWYEWEREEVRTEILNGTYRFEDTCEVWSMPTTSGYHKLGSTKIVHDLNGFDLQGSYNEEPFHIVREPIENYSIQIEWELGYCMKGRPTFAVHTLNDSFFCSPANYPLAVSKISLATEELYKIVKAKK